MARDSGRKPVSKSARQQQDERHEADRRADTPLFSFEGLSVHKRKLAAIFAAILLVPLGLFIAVGAVTSPAALDLTSSAAFAQARSGDPANFTLTVRNSAAFVSYAYEAHVLALPPGWSTAVGETAFALSPGASRTIPLSLSTGADAPPGHDYPLTVKVIVKTGDLSRTLASKSISLTVRIVASDLRLVLESRVTTGNFAANDPSLDLSFSGCAGAPSTVSYEVPAGANITSASFTVNYNFSDPNATGYLTADVGADGSIEANITLVTATPRLTLGQSGFANYTAAHPAAPGTNLTVPIAIAACTNTTMANFTLNGALINYQHPTPAGQLVLAEASNPAVPTASARFLARIVNNEPRPLTFIVGLPNLPSGWELTPALATTPIPVSARSSNILDFTVHIAKTAPQGQIPLNFTACLQANPADCATAAATVDMPVAPYFTVKTYVEPANLKEVVRGRSTDIILFAQNLGNVPTAFTIEVPPRPGLEVTFFDGSGNLSLSTDIPLALGQRRLFVMHVSPDPTASSSVYTVTPTFRNASAGLIQSNLFLSINVLDPPAVPNAAREGSRLTVDFIGVTDKGLLFDTNMLAFLPLVDQKQRPTHPQYARPASTGVTPFEFTLDSLANYTNTAHKGFEPYLLGALERETLVFWLTPEQTKLPVTAFLKDETLVFEVRITVVNNTPASGG